MLVTPRRHPTAGLVALLAAVACEDTEPSGRLNDPCTSTMDCEPLESLRCVNNRCSEEVPLLSVGFEVTPPIRLAPELGPSPQSFALSNLEGRRPQILNLSPTTSVFLEADRQVDVTIRRLPPVLPGRSFVRSLRVYPVGAGRSELSRVQLLPIGEDRDGLYEIVAQPVLTLPAIERPPAVERFQVEAGTSTITVPATDFIALRGRVVRSTQQSVPVPGVLVVAEGLTSGRASSRAETDESGRFTIELPDADFGDEQVRIRAIPPEAQQPAWSFGEVQAFPDRDQEDLVVPLEPPVEEERRCVQLAVVDGLQRVPRAAVELEAVDVRAPTIAFRMAGRGRRDGVVERIARRDAQTVTSTANLPLMAGAYEVRIRPPEIGLPGDPPLDLSRYPTLDPGLEPKGLPFGFTTTRLEVPRADGLVEPGRDPCDTDAVAELQLTVPPRKLVIGRVIAASRPLERRPRLRFTPIGQEDLGGLSVRVEATGNFAAFLEPGCWLWTAEPVGADRLTLPVGFGVVRVDPIESPDVGLVQRVRDPFVIPDGVTIDGRVLRPDGTSGAPFAEVEAFSQILGVAASIPLDRAFTSLDGRFIMRLPVRPSPSPADCEL